MAVLLNHVHPEMRILIPGTGQYRNFSGGKLEIEADDPDYSVVMAEASRNPSIVVYESVTTCPWCGEPFAGKGAPMQLGKHEKEAHFEKWAAKADAKAAEVRNAEIKARSGFACDQCPHATFPDEATLALHVQVMHTAAPAMDDEGNTLGEAKGAAEATVPAAKPTA